VIDGWLRITNLADHMAREVYVDPRSARLRQVSRDDPTAYRLIGNVEFSGLPVQNMESLVGEGPAALPDTADTIAVDHYVEAVDAVFAELG
jgi:hypothetical protein